MTMPSRRSCSPRSTSSSTAVAILYDCPVEHVKSSARALLGLGGYSRSLIIHLYLGIVPERANHLIAAGDNLVSRLQSRGDFDIRGAGYSRTDGVENSLLAIHDENALHSPLHPFHSLWTWGPHRLPAFLLWPVAF